MKSKMDLGAHILLLVLLTASVSMAPAHPAQGAGVAPASEAAAGAQVSQTAAPSAGGQETLRVLEGRSMVVNTSEVLKRVSITNDQIAAAIIVSPNQLLIHGLKPGTVSLLMWNEQEQVRAFDLQVQAIPINLESLQERLGTLLPGEDIQISQSGNSVVLKGTASSNGAAERALAIVKTQVPGVLSLLSVPPMNQIVLLQVKFAEVGRNAVRQLGVNLFSTGATNTIGTISTQQFAPPSTTSAGETSNFRLTDLLNIFLFRPDLDLGVAIKALQQNSLIETLAEPNLLAVGGKEASFLAGGEVPIPIVQGTTGTPVVTVQFKEFGVRLKFLADPEPDGTIRLKVNPEVSALDYANAVTLTGFLIPAITTRKAETEVVLRDGQSFAIAGLMDNRVQKIGNKVPWLGDLPLLGKLFRSEEFKKGNTELLVMVTPHLVKPLDAGQLPPLPTFPVPLMDTQAFDRKVGEVPAGKTAQPPK